MNGKSEPENKNPIRDASGNAIKVVLVPITADAVPAICPIGEIAMAFIFPKMVPKTKKFGKRMDMTV